MTKPEVRSLVAAKANQYGVPPNIALGIAAHESGFNDQAVNRNNPNGTSDWGVMQLNDTTVQTMGVSNPLDAEQNVDAGVRLLASLLGRYSGDVYNALWAYASGPGNVGPGKTPNTIAKNFIAYVTSYQGGAPAVPGSASPPSGTTDETPSEFIDDGSAAPDDSSSSDGFAEWGLIAGIAVAAGLVWWAALRS